MLDPKSSHGSLEQAVDREPVFRGTHKSLDFNSITLQFIFFIIVFY